MGLSINILTTVLSFVPEVMFAALSGGDIAVLITAIGGLITGIGGLIVGARGQNKTDKNSQLAVLLEGYDEIVANLHTEISRLVADLVAARASLAECETRCRDCEMGMAALERTIEELGRQIGLDLLEEIRVLKEGKR